MSLFQLQQQIVLSFIQGASPREHKGCPRVSAITDIRYHNIRHLVEPMSKQGWKCGRETCKSRPSQWYLKCKIPLCEMFH